MRWLLAPLTAAAFVVGRVTVVRRADGRHVLTVIWCRAFSVAFAAARLA
jgi:hypothetical protein